MKKLFTLALLCFSLPAFGQGLSTTPFMGELNRTNTTLAGLKSILGVQYPFWITNSVEGGFKNGILPIRIEGSAVFSSMVALQSNSFPIASFAELGNSGCFYWNSNGVMYLVCTNSLTTTAVTNQIGALTNVYEFALSDETTVITTGTAKVSWRAPYPMILRDCRASLTTASSSGLPTVNIKEAGTTIFSTKLTIDANELTSTTAATPYVFSDTAIADDALITFDIDVAGTGATGLKVKLYYTR